ncbi:MAG: hypothetical protein ACE5J2_08675 [Nitrososphaerales archaeon]
MKLLPCAAITLGAILILSTVLVSYNSPASAAVQKATEITIDDVPSKVRPSDEVALTGSLMTSDGEPITDATINIYLLTSDPQLIIVASGVTGLEGTYEITWNVELLPTDRALHDVTKQVDTQVASLFAQFEGNDDFVASRTAKTTITIEVNSINTFVNPDKKLYNKGDRAIIFIGFTDADDEFVDPDWIQSSFNLEPISEQLERKKVGSYTYMTPPLEKVYNQMTVVPQKEGYNIQTEVITITVMTTEPIGVFG